MVQIAQGAGLNAFQRGNTHDDVGTQAVGKAVQNCGGVVAFQVNQNGGDDLRMFVAYQFGNGCRVHPLQAFNA